jgi:oligopeptide transport system ATP-binding protein
MENDRLLEIRDLHVEFDSEDGVVLAVEGMSLHVDKGETLVIVGESGSGKSVTSLATMRLIPSPPGRIARGEILFRGKDGQARDLTRLSEKEMRRIRGNDIAMVFQEPMTSLNPVYTVGDQIMEAIMLHQRKSRHEVREQAIEMLALMGIPDPVRRLENYPHQMSGGMRQRVMIAMALSCNPALLIADEPTTALDVTIQAQILELIARLQAELDMAVLFITHNLGVVADIADRVMVMYAGRTVEEADVHTVFTKPRMPYTMGLLESVPRLDVENAGEMEALSVIPGNVPNPLDLPAGCPFHPRCRFAVPGLCDGGVPPLETCGEGHRVRCARWREIGEEVSR